MVSRHGFAVGRPIPRGAVMVVCIGSTTGKVAMAMEECITNQQINSVVCSDGVNQNFVYHLFKQMGNLFFREASCTALPILNKTQFSNLTVSIPALSDQNRIIKQISHFEETGTFLIENINRLRLLIKNLREN